MNRKFALLLVLSGAVNVAVGQTFVTTGTLHEDRFAHTATLLSDGTVLVAGGTTFFGPTATAEMYNPDTGEWSYASGKLNTARTGHAAVRLDDGKVLIIGGSDQASNPLSSVELFDPETETFRLMASLPNSLSSGQAFNVGNDKVVFIQRNGQGSGVAIFDYSSNSWKPGATVPKGGQSPAMTMLANGNIFVCGGWDEASDVEIYNPSGDSWTSLAPMAQGRTSPIATALSNGNVFITSGFAEGTDGAYALSSTEIYNPNSSPNGASVLGPTLPQPGPLGSGLANALMPSGKVLITGGGYSPSYGAVNVPLAQAAIYDPASNIITAVGPMNVSRQNHTAIALTNGNVLLVGGITDQGYGSVTSAGITAVCELLGNAPTPQQPGEFVSTGTLATALIGQQATTLTNGTVLLTGGGAGQDSATTATAQIYNPASASFRYTKDNMTTPRTGHTSSLLPDGRVLIAGGSNGNPDTGGCLSSTEIYDPVADTFTAAAPMNYCRHGHQAVTLSDGRIMVISGYSETSSPIVTNTVEIFDPKAAAWTVVAPLPSGRASFAATRLLDGNVLISGGYWATDANGLQAIYVYNLTTNTWTSMAPMLAPRENHIAITLPTGKVLMVGGNDGTAAIGFSELYDTSAKPSGNSTVAGGISVGGWAANAVLLLDGNVWSAGGYSQLLAYSSSGYEVCSAGLPTAQVYNYLTNSWTDFSSMQISRFNASASLLPSGQVLVAGGFEQTCPDGGQTVLSEAELWQESTGTGTIDASTNLASATFTITGPATYNGTGKSFTQTNAPVGNYTITYGSVAKYITPASQTGTLTAAQTLTFSEGLYVPITLTACATPSSSTCIQSLSFSYPQGFVGPIKPQDILVSSNAGAINFTATPSSSPSAWLVTSVSSGMTSQTVGVSVAPDPSLTPGMYRGQVVFTSTDATNPQTINVNLTVTPQQPQGFLIFPLKVYAPSQTKNLHLTPKTAYVNVVFDHSMASATGDYQDYGCDRAVVAFTGQSGAMIDPQTGYGGCNDGYAQDKNLRPFVISGMSYSGPRDKAHPNGDNQHLYYDGHTGIDYRSEMSNFVYAAADGIVTYPEEMVGISNKYGAAAYHVLEIDPTGYPDYRIYYLHLSTYYDASKSPKLVTDPFPSPGCPSVVPLPLEPNTPVKAGCLIALSGDQAPPSHPVSPHLHFEVQRVLPAEQVSNAKQARIVAACKDKKGYVCLPVDPYGWTASNADPDPYQKLTGVTNKLSLWR
jgi:N-acetylneuraminic acid mutarotase/murein DD-endopeptidase MepM/ murein hydrolase activator NlpD